jgi:hypothetical protein
MVTPESATSRSSGTGASLGLKILGSLGVLLVSAPLAIVVTLVLSSGWKWLEATHGIEAFGHSGPAEWCYVATYVGCVVLLGASAALLRRGRTPTRDRGG